MAEQCQECYLYGGHSVDCSRPPTNWQSRALAAEASLKQADRDAATNRDGWRECEKLAERAEVRVKELEAFVRSIIDPEVRMDWERIASEARRLLGPNGGWQG